MDIGDLLSTDGVVASLKAATKKDALRALAEKASALTGVEARTIFDTLVQRERLGSTGLGRGIAVPHVKLKELSGLYTIFARLEEPVDFESHDGEKVDLMFLLLAPEHAGGDHLKALARISRLVRDPATLEGLRGSRDAAAIRRVLTTPRTSHAA